MSLLAWLAVIAVLAVAVIAALAVIGLSGTDRIQQLRLLQWLAEGRLDGALDKTSQTSGPGMAVVLPVYLAARPFLSVSSSYAVASVACLIPLGVAVVAAARAFGVAARSPRELLALVLVVGSVPTLANYLEIFHPADVLALAAILGAYAAVLHRRIPVAALLLGLGLASKQWVIVAVAVLAILETGRDRIVLAVGPLVVFAVLIVPFAVVDLELTLTVLAAKVTLSTSRVLPGLLPLGSSGAYLVSRYLPLVAVFLLCWWLRDRGARSTPLVAITALGVALGLRAAIDTAGYGYYAAPGYAALVIALVGTLPPRRLLAISALLLAAGGLLWLRLHVYEWPTIEFRAVRGRVVSDRAIQHTSVPWAVVETALLTAIPVICMVLLERASRPDAERPVPAAAGPVPEQADPGESAPVCG